MEMKNIQNQTTKNIAPKKIEFAQIKKLSGDKDI